MNKQTAEEKEGGMAIADLVVRELSMKDLLPAKAVYAITRYLSVLLRAAVKTEREKLQPWIQHKSNCGRCEDPQCNDSTWDHYCGETSECTCGLAAIRALKP